MDRRDVGSWMSGPRAALPDGAAGTGWRGQRLGLPESGPGSVAGFGRRVAALAVDWAACLLVTRLFFPGLEYGSPASGLATLGIFALEVVVLTWLTGGSFGQRLLGVVVAGTAGRPPGLPAVVVRTALLCLVVPAVVYDADGRGLHDRAARTVAVRAGARPAAPGGG